MAGYPSLSHPATYWVQPRLPSVHLRFWYSPWFNVIYLQFEQVPLRTWSIPVCCSMKLLWRVTLLGNILSHRPLCQVEVKLLGADGAQISSVEEGCSVQVGGHRLARATLAVPACRGWLWGGSDAGSPDAAEIFKELKVTPCGRAVSMPSTGQAVLVKGNPFPL